MVNKYPKFIERTLSKLYSIFDKLFFLMFRDVIEQENEIGLEYFKNIVFYKLSMLFIVFGSLPICYGTYMFLKEGLIFVGILECLIYIAITVVLLSKNIGIIKKKKLFILFFFSLDILILFMTGTNGGGLVLLVATFAISGFLFENKQNIVFVCFNFLLFIFISILLNMGYLDNMAISQYANTWYIRVITTQFTGILLLVVISVVFKDLECQHKHIEKSNRVIKQSEERFRLLFDKAPLGYQSLDAEGCFIDVNQQWLDTFGYERSEVIGKWFGDFLTSEYADFLQERFPIFKKQGYIQTEFKMMHKDGNAIFIAFDGKIGNDFNGIFKQTHCILKDITEQRKAEEALAYAGTHDYLTDLFTHRYFEDIKEKIDKENRSPVSIINMDINGVRLINDAFGHSKGDRLIIETSKIIQSCCSENEILARTGGDDFSILMFADEEQATQLVYAIKNKCNEYNQAVREMELKIYLSIGFGTKHGSEGIEIAQKEAEKNLNKNKLLDSRSHHSSMISSIIATMHAGSHETMDHAERIAQLSKKLGDKINLSQNNMDELHLFSMLHDIGKIGIDDSILNKRGKLTSEEWVEMKKHPEIGYGIAISTNELNPIAKYILTHHEWWDGSGYPDGLRGEQIPLLSRILAIVDAYDAMTQNRVYRAALTNDAAISEIEKNTGIQFDPQFTKLFIDIIKNH